jgi:hypothetical protein
VCCYSFCCFAYEALKDKSLAFVIQQCDNPVYDSVHDMDSTGERVWAHRELTGVTEILQQNRIFGGLYNLAHKFQKHGVIKWRGPKEPFLKLMPCPLSVNSETRTKECGNVVLSMLKLASFIKSRGKTAGTKLEVFDGYDKQTNNGICWLGMG